MIESFYFSGMLTPKGKENYYTMPFKYLSVSLEYEEEIYSLTLYNNTWQVDKYTCDCNMKRRQV